MCTRKAHIQQVVEKFAKSVTIKHLYFASRIFHGFHKLFFICEINFQQKLFQRRVICIFYIIHTSSTPNGTVRILQESCMSHRVHSQIQTVLYGRIPSEAISSAFHRMSGLVGQDTGQNSKTMINTSRGRGRRACFAETKSLSSSLSCQSLFRR